MFITPNILKESQNICQEDKKLLEKTEKEIKK